MPKDEPIKSTDNISGDYNTTTPQASIMPKLDKKSTTSFKKLTNNASKTVYGSPERKPSSKVDQKSLSGSKSLPKQSTEVMKTLNTQSASNGEMAKDL